MKTSASTAARCCSFCCFKVEFGLGADIDLRKGVGAAGCLPVKADVLRTGGFIRPPRLLTTTLVEILAVLKGEWV